MTSANLLTAFRQLLDQLKQRRVRAVVVLSGTRSWAQITAQTLAPCCGDRIAWVSTQTHACGQLIEPGQYRHYLGTEHDCLIFNAFDGLHPNALAALTGTVVGGGVLLLLTPTLESWPAFDDPDYRRLGTMGFAAKPHRFIQRFAGLLRASTCWLVKQHANLPALPVITGPVVGPREFSLTADQQAAITAIDRVARGHRRRPLVITADRGRGKSTALGVAAGRLLAEGLGEVVVTAPYSAAIAPVFEYCLKEFPGGQRRENAITWPNACLRFVPPDELQRTLPPLDLLLVDEAAAIPAPMLASLLKQYSRMVFASTVHGYEGSGRGFALRFQRELEQQTPGYKNLQLHEPVRWSGSDVVEPWLFASFLLAAEVPELSVTTAFAPVIAEVSQDQLANQPALLEQVFGLLVQAHYRTTPDDLRVLLDAPNLRLFVVRSNGLVCATVMVGEEGGLAPDLWEPVSRSERRVSGHVLPQVMAAQAALTGHLGWSCWRVIRIAVHPAARRQGVGLQLLRHIEQAAQREQIDYLGANFATSTDVVAFWQRAAFKPLHLGWRRDSSTGSHALTVAKGLSSRACELVNQGATRVALELPALMSDHLSELSPALVTALLRASGAASAVVVDAFQTRLIREFVDANRPYETCSLAVRAAALQLLCADQAISAIGRDVLVLRCLQLKPWVELARRCGLAGKPQVLDVLRQACRQWLAGSARD